MMKIKELFTKKIDRDLQGVIIVGQGEETNVVQELEEYVVTRELQKHFADFLPPIRRGSTGRRQRRVYGSQAFSVVVNRTF